VVTSIKLIARDTVEARVLRLQESKRELLRSTLDAETAWGALQEEDLAALLA
jgi:SNF2 family DNA or RNA helicase